MIVGPSSGLDSEFWEVRLVEMGVVAMVTYGR